MILTIISVGLAFTLSIGFHKIRDDDLILIGLFFLNKLLKLEMPNKKMPNNMSLCLERIQTECSHQNDSHSENQLQEILHPPLVQAKLHSTMQETQSQFL